MSIGLYQVSYCLNLSWACECHWFVLVYHGSSLPFSEHGLVLGCYKQQGKMNCKIRFTLAFKQVFTLLVSITIADQVH